MLRLALVFLLAGQVFAAEKYALLIGISHYLPGQNLRDLAGPGPDVDDLYSDLTSKFGFRRENITMLRDSQASKAGILAALDALIARVSQGDYVLLYYSGHGTSPQDEFWNGQLPIDADTGALIPADFRRGTAQEVAQRLIVGRTDLRPRLLKLDGKATVFGLLDTCYSANLMRDIRPRGELRSVPLSQLVTKRGMEDDIAKRESQQGYANTSVSTPYPYHSVAWISAALAGQAAEDIADTSKTLDGKAHGQFTNALLKGLNGAADRNHDGTITHAELYDYLSNQAVDWSHQPAWSSDSSNRALPNLPLFAQNSVRPPVNGTRPPAGPVHVALEGGAAALRSRISGLAGITVVNGDADLTVRQEGSGFRIYQSGGVPIMETPVDADAAIERVAAEPNVRKLVSWTYANQHTNVDLSFWREGQLMNEGAAAAGTVLSINVKTEMPAWPLIVDIDITGTATVLYPVKANPGGSRTPAGSPFDIGQNLVRCPCGLDYVKTFLFDTKPAGYESWADQVFAAGSPKLAQLLETVRGGSGETTRPFLTTTGR